MALAGETVSPPGRSGGSLTIRVEAGAGGGSMERAFADLVLGLIRTGVIRLVAEQGRVRPA
ncbi:hypothetical protein [Salinispora arenicola]|uniref:hypothetical protein n=1 Tax=Salinispora arenicola TaxID=168697 RepID=UPI0027DCACE9|nr:hypothetical protein [Salinispora arenicola]